MKSKEKNNKNLKTFKFAIKPNKEQEEYLYDCCSASQLVKNEYILLAEADNKEEKKPNFTAYNKNITRWRTYGKGFEDRYFNKEGNNWGIELLRKCPSRDLNHIANQLRGNFFTKGGGSRLKPKPLRLANSFQTDSYKLEINEDKLKKSHIFLSNPASIKKPHKVKLIMHRSLDGRKPKIATIKHQAGKWYVCIVGESQTIQKKVKIKKTIGLDFGIKDHVTDNKGNTFHIPTYKDVEARQARLNQKLALCKKGSKNFRKIKSKIARLKHYEANKKKHARHAISRQIVSENDGIAVEDFEVKKIVEKTEEDKKILRRVKKATNKKLVGGGLAEIISQIQYKSELEGKTCKMVDPKYTSMTCSCCGFINRNLTLDEREWDCPECGTHLFRDPNAAEVVRQRAFG